jgi:hypothetical protein
VRGRSGAAAAMTLAAILVLAAAACGSPVETAKGPPPSIASADASAAGSPSPSSSSAPSTGPTASAPPPASTSASSAPTAAGGTVEDSALLSILPPDLGGVPLTLESQAFADATADPGFAQNVASAAFAVAVQGNDLASAVVAKLVPGVYSDAFFRDWRDTYDRGACGQAGGVTGNAETQLGSRTVYIGTCAGGLRTYHAWLPERGVLVSAFSLGDKLFGEQLMDGLRP